MTKKAHIEFVQAMTKFDKHAVQDWLRQHPWGMHFILDAEAVQPAADDCIANSLKKTNYLLCKRFLDRRFSKRPLAERFHYIGFFQGQRDAGTRHIHVLLHVPECARSKDSFQQLKLRSAVQTAWIVSSTTAHFPWVRTIQDADDNSSVATYVSRHCSAASWFSGDVQFSA